MRLRKVCLILLVTLLIVCLAEPSFARLRVVVRPCFPRALVLVPWPRAVIVAPDPRPVASSGYLELNIIPKDSDVYVDDIFMGKGSRFASAAEYISLDPGSHSVSIRRTGFKTQNFIIKTSAGKVVELDVALKLESKEKKTVPVATYEVDISGTGNLSFNVEPSDAALYIDGNFQGGVSEFSESSAMLVLRAGKHKVDIVKPGYESYAITTDIVEGRIKEIVAKLKKLE